MRLTDSLRLLRTPVLRICSAKRKGKENDDEPTVAAHEEARRRRD